MPKLTKAQLSAASKAGHAAGKPTSQAYKMAFCKKLAQMRGERTQRKTEKRTRKAAARRQPGETRRANIKRRVKTGFSNLTLGQGMEAYIAGEGLVEGLKEGYSRLKSGTLKPNWETAKAVLADPVDAALTAKAFHLARTSKLTAPLAKDIFNTRPLKGDFGDLMHTNVKKVVVGLPSVLGWAQGIRGYKQGVAGNTASLLPRFTSATGLNISSDLRQFGWDKGNFMRSAGPVAAGGIVSFGADKLVSSTLIPAPLKRVGQLHA